MSTINPTISIIVPVYNVEKYLSRCIQSILCQTFSDFELILVDDGSKDHSRAICEEFSKRDSRISVIHKENGGVASARNAALRIAVGQYVMFCDSDDYVSPDWVQQLYSVVCSYANAFVNCNAWTVASDGNMVLRCDVENPNKIIRMNSYFDLYVSSLDSSLWNKIYSGEIIRERQLRFNEDLRIGEDVIFNVEYYKTCNQIIFINSPLYFYCSNTTSLTHTYRPNNMEMHRVVFTARLQVIEEEYLGNYLDNWLYRFIQMLNEVFDKRNTMSFRRKMQYCQKMMQTEEFQYCVSHAPGKDESPTFMKVIRKHNFYLFWIFQKMCKFMAHLRYIKRR
ncbi:MAG: glycosyltransferase family 2 protein [Lachnospiraceae bacterium]